MKFSEDISLAELTTFKLGGKTRGVAACLDVDDVRAALALADERNLPWYVMGGGSNLLASDAGFDGIIIKMEGKEMVFSESDDDTNDATVAGDETSAVPASASTVVAIAEAGAVWDEFVEASITRGLWGLENLAGIPGSVGGAPVQNIGAYGADVSHTLLWVEAYDTSANELHRFANEECSFDYRESRFKHDSSLIIMRVAFTLSRNGTPHIDYADLKRKSEERAQAGTGAEQLDTPVAIARAVCEIRAGKFPDLRVSGTAGSFFKNPTISKAAFEALHTNYPELPGYAGEDGVKISLAWILDHVLHLRGYSQAHVRLFEKQPLVIVAETGATANDVDTLAREIETLVFNSTGIHIEREVRMLGEAHE